MLRGQVAIFLCCSEKFKREIAWPVRDVLAGQGLCVVIMTDEPPLLDTHGDPEAKAGAYLDASSALVALCTADYELSDGTKYPRANIIDEVQQARTRPHLRDRLQVLKSPAVLLPSDIAPTYDRLDVARPEAAAAVIGDQFRRWGILPALSPAPRQFVAAGSAEDVQALVVGLRPGARDEARRRVYPLLRDRSEEERQRIAGELCLEITESGDSTRRLAAAAVLEATSMLDAPLVPAQMIEMLAGHAEYQARSCAASLLRDRAAVAPLAVPVGVLGRLAAPGAEDWFVWAPAIAAAQELVLHRRDAYAIFESLAGSPDPQDRYVAAEALLGIAAVKPAAVASGLADQLAADADPLIAAKAREVVAVIEQVTDTERACCYVSFGGQPIPDAVQPPGARESVRSPGPGG